MRFDGDGEMECPGCRELLAVDQPLGVELSVREQPSLTSEPGQVEIVVGGIVVHRCGESE